MIESELHRIVREAHNIAPTTRDRYLRDLNQWIEYAGVDPAGWTRKRAAAFYTALLARPMKPQSANRLMSSIAFASRWRAHLENNPALDFADGMRAKSKDKKVQQALDEDTARRLLATCDDSPLGRRDFALTVVGLETGMRRMSLASMTLEDTLLGPAPRWPYPAAFVELKGKEPAWVPLSDTAVMAIKHWLAWLCDRDAVQSGPLFRPLDDPRAGRVLANTTIAKIFDKRAKAAGLSHINPHLLRHTFVTWRSEQGLQPHEIAAITHHDITKALGALGGYIDQRATGGRVRNTTPTWLAEFVQARCGEHL